MQKYWVGIDGVPWPVKQALRLIVGPDVYFQSLTARDKFRRLGFTIGGGSEPNGALSTPRTQRSRRLDPLSLPRPVA